MVELYIGEGHSAPDLATKEDNSSLYAFCSAEPSEIPGVGTRGRSGSSSGLGPAGAVPRTSPPHTATATARFYSLPSCDFLLDFPENWLFL